MSDQLRIMDRIMVCYKPYLGQQNRCSLNFKNWNLPKAGKLKFKIVVPDGCSLPHFNLRQERIVGSDQVLYEDLWDGKEIDLNDKKMRQGKRKVYVETVNPFHKISYMMLQEKNKLREFREILQYEIIVYIEH
ncbi:MULTISPECIES: hypothetical protein [Acinetobacter]|uniref:Uncharacterized protein n=1 Tax=Acinetobacter corruptisaponis TaxID=3045147 RepID=A0ABY8S958_9GAMM|nr:MULTISPECIES: hypothetical protein [Acinetobacter]MDH0030552.1 hypothetical protein [Acinetobacter sp. GD04021]MDH0885559.1 hypothetical protein [Acinetobacter sp. GD03873]MDH1082125.1 hypothetical protein [Acinetobacter sp. GD03983]MDH2188845.1 hypothetical protein [Acinetobacter sp. GD03645]MDH2202594.1 hypothetical protein [Acinetobacter sp. GD03647]